VDQRILQAAQRVRCLLLDVDGGLTDGGLYYFAEEGLALRFHVRDGLGLRKAVERGLIAGLVSGRSSPQVLRRGEELGLQEIHLAVGDKQAAVAEILQRRGLDAEEICFVGDDVVDLPAMRMAGLSVAVADAHPRVRHEADWITRARGGDGAVREVIDLLLGEGPAVEERR